jgi:flagellar hook-length control protein FliK
MGAGPVPAVTDAHVPSAEAGAQDASTSGARFADAMHSARDPSDGAAPAHGSQLAAPHSAPGAPAAPAARVRSVRAATTARSGAPANTVPANSEPAGASAAIDLRLSAPVAGSTLQPDEDSGADAGAEVGIEALADLLPSLASGSPGKGAGARASSAAAGTGGAVASSAQPGASVSDPVGLLAMILGVAPAVSSPATAVPGSAGAAAAPTADASAAPSATGATPDDKGAASSAANAGTALNLPVPQLVATDIAAPLGALTDAAVPKADTAAQAAQGPGASVQSLSELMRGLAPPAAPAPTTQPNIAVPVGSAGWPGAVAAQVQWLASSGINSATLHLSPEHLGPVQVFIDAQSSQINVSFSAAHPDTRAALEQALPKLREMFATGGLALGQATVQQEARSGSQSSAPARVTRVADSPPALAAPPGGEALGLVDEYA